MRVVRTTLLTVCGVLGVTVGWYYTSLKPLSTDAALEAVFDVSEGSSVARVAVELEEKGIIKSATAFKWYTKLHNLDTSVSAGRFTLSPAMSVPEVAQNLTGAGKGASAILTFPEGYTALQMIDRVVANKLATKEEMIKCLETCSFKQFDFLPTNKKLEGYLFPDTYHFDHATFSPQLFFTTLLSHFDTSTKKLREQAAREGKNWADIVQVAAMLEREARHEEDFAPIAGIIFKRLDAGWALGIDATLLYNDTDSILTVEELARDTPYNTRTRAGLPPTPIANPGIKALTAATNPTQTPYWFYITDPKTGKAVYAKNSDEHARNVVRYLR